MGSCGTPRTIKQRPERVNRYPVSHHECNVSWLDSLAVSSRWSDACWVQAGKGLPGHSYQEGNRAIPCPGVPDISLNRPALTYPRVAAFLHPVTPVGSNPLPPRLGGLPVFRYRLIGFPLFDFHVLAVVLGCQLGLAQRGVDLSQGLMGVPLLELR